MNIVDLPQEMQNKIFYFYAEHPCAKILKDELNSLFAFHTQKLREYMSERKALHVFMSHTTEVLYDTFREMFAEVYLSKITDRIRELDKNESEVDELESTELELQESETDESESVLSEINESDSDISDDHWFYDYRS